MLHLLEGPVSAHIEGEKNPSTRLMKPQPSCYEACFLQQRYNPCPYVAFVFIIGAVVVDALYEDSLLGGESKN